MIDAESTLRAMLEQEESSYRVDDYFQDLPSHSPGELLPVDADARQKIAKWCMNITEACRCSNEIAAVIMSCLDRFVSTENGKMILLDRCQYQLAALTALYSSVKMHCPLALAPATIAKLSRGEYEEKDIESMERRMLDALKWRVNPPTAMDFVRIYLDLSIVWEGLDLRKREDILELVCNQINFSILNFEISTSKASDVAIAALLNAAKTICPNEKEFYESIQDVASFSCDIDQESIELLQCKLSRAIDEVTGTKVKEINEVECSSSVNMKSDSFTRSPRSVYEYNTHII